MKNRTIVVIITIVIAALIIARLTSNKKQLNERNRPVKTVTVRIPVKVVMVKKQSLTVNLVKICVFSPIKEAKVLANTSGVLIRTDLELGSRVSEGQVLAVTDIRTRQLEVQKSEVNAAKLRNDLDTYTELETGSAATRQQVADIRLSYSNAVSQSALARKQLADAYVKAPTSGMISSRQAEKGMFVNSGGEIATIVNLSKAKVQLRLTETEVYQVRLAQKVKITIDIYPGKLYNGIVKFISPQADAAHNYLVEVQVDNNNGALLRSGTFVYADFCNNAVQQHLVIPWEALVQNIKNPEVYVVSQGIARRRAITIGAKKGELVVITSGLSGGEQVVTSGQINVHDGSPVVISN